MVASRNTSTTGFVWRWLVAMLMPTIAWGHEPISTKLSWNGQIRAIVEARCGGCHGENAAGPMALRTYGQVRPWAVAIKEEVLERRMPPWPAAKGFGGPFRNDPSLSQAEMQMIADWVLGGAPEGEATVQRPNFAGENGRGQESKREELVPTLAGKRVVLRPGMRLAAGTVLGFLPQGPARLFLDGEPLVWIQRGGGRRAQTLVLVQPREASATGRITGTGRVTAIVRPRESNRGGRLRPSRAVPPGRDD